MKLFVAFRFQGIHPGFQKLLAGGRPETGVEDDLAPCLQWVEEHHAVLHVAAETYWLRNWERDAASLAHARRLIGAQRLVPVVTHSEGAHVAFLSATELADELRHNRKAIHRVFQMPDPVALGVWGSAWGVDLGKLAATVNLDSVSWVVIPTPAPATRFAGYSLAKAKDANFRLLPARTLYRDRMSRLVADVRAKRRTIEEAAGEFAQLLAADAPGNAPDAPKLVCLDLGAGEAAWVTGIFSRAVQHLKEQGPVTFIGAADLEQAKTGITTHDRQVFGYYPEETELVRTDGLYAAVLQATAVPEPYQPLNLVARRPFILWDEGSFLLQLLDYFYDGFHFPKVLGDVTGGSVGAAPAVLQNDPAFLLRHIKHASYWGPRLSTPARKAALVPLGAMVALFRAALNRGPIARPAMLLPESVTRGLRAVLRFQIDNPVAAYEHHWKQTETREGYLRMTARLKEIREHRQRAWEGISRLESAVAALIVSPGAWFRAVDMLDVYIRESMLALEALESFAELDAVAETFYRTMSPPQLPVFLDRLESAAPPVRGPESPGVARHSHGEVPGEMHPW